MNHSDLFLLFRSTDMVERPKVLNIQTQFNPARAKDLQAVVKTEPRHSEPAESTLLSSITRNITLISVFFKRQRMLLNS